jgi:hypothetical protein
MSSLARSEWFDQQSEHDILHRILHGIHYTVFNGIHYTVFRGLSSAWDGQTYCIDSSHNYNMG